MGNPNTYHDLWKPREFEAVEYDPGDFDYGPHDYFRPHRLYGTGHARMFPGGKPSAAPFAPAPSYIPDRRTDLIHAHVKAAVRGLAHPEEIDPRWLKMTQSAVTSSGVQYYMGPKYAESGQTYADQHQAGNRYPVIYQHSKMGQRYILSGHHRASAALASGKPLVGLVVRDDDESILGSQR